MQSPDLIKSDFDRIAQLPSRKWTSNNHYYSSLLRYVPNVTHRILDVGCGKGDFCRLLSGKAQEVIGLDISDSMIGAARQNVVDIKNVTFHRGDYLQKSYPENHFDVITSIATVHHFSLSKFLVKAKKELKKEGLLIVLDLYQRKTIVDFLYSLVAGTFNICYQLFHNKRIRGSATERKLWASHGRHDQYLSLPLLRSIYTEHLEQFEFKRHLFWRYSMIWKK